eukprot:138751-Rhodomonas_salina.2
MWARREGSGSGVEGTGNSEKGTIVGFNFGASGFSRVQAQPLCMVSGQSRVKAKGCEPARSGRLQASGFRLHCGSGFRVQGSGFSVQEDLGVRLQAIRFRVRGRCGRNPFQQTEQPSDGKHDWQTLAEASPLRKVMTRKEGRLGGKDAAGTWQGSAEP